MATDLYLLAGFLGTGKTTTLEHVVANLPSGGDVLVIINEAGDKSLDGRLVERWGIQVRELANGCVCCALEVDFIGLLKRIFETPRPPAKILMEASGLANPLKIQKILKMFAGHLGVCKTIVVLDAEVWGLRDGFGDFFNQQLAAADLLLLNKADLLIQADVVDILGQMAAELPGTKALAATYGQVEMDEFWQAPLYKPDRLFIEAKALMGFETFTYESAKTISADGFERLIEEMGPGWARMKGQALFEDGPVYLDYVRGRLTRRPPLKSLGGTVLVFIGQTLNREALARRLKALAIN